VQTKENSKEKKARKTRKEEAELMGSNDEKHLKETETMDRSDEVRKERAELLGRVEENRPVTKTVDYIPASHDVASINPPINYSANVDPASQT
jgi:predicted Holliday junction resolvase-like endonuclease